MSSLLNSEFKRVNLSLSNENDLIQGHLFQPGTAWQTVPGLVHLVFHVF
jgi:hypothetical protein